MESNARIVTRTFTEPVTGTAELQVFAYAAFNSHYGQLFPDDLAAYGSLLAVNEYLPQFGSPGFTSFFDLSQDAQKPVFIKKVGNANLGLAMLSKNNKIYAFTDDIGNLEKIDASNLENIRIVEGITSNYGNATKLVAHPRKPIVFIGGTGSILSVAEVK